MSYYCVSKGDCQTPILQVTDAIDRSYDSVVKRHCKNYPGIVAKHQAIKLVEDTAQDLSSFMSNGQQKMSKRMTFRP